MLSKRCLILKQFAAFAFPVHVTVVINTHVFLDGCHTCKEIASTSTDAIKWALHTPTHAATHSRLHASWNQLEYQQQSPSCTNPAATRMKGCACMSQADTHHAASRNNALTTTRASTKACRSPHRSRMLTSLKSRSRTTPAHSKLCQGERNPEWNCEMHNDPKPTPRVHARITTPLTQPAWAGRRQQGVCTLILTQA